MIERHSPTLSMYRAIDAEEGELVKVLSKEDTTVDGVLNSF
jgi:hypothetical protein